MDNNNLSKVERMYKLLQECEAKGTTEREYSIKLLENTFSIYSDLLKERGNSYCSRKCPDVPRRMNELVDKLMEHNT